MPDEIEKTEFPSNARKLKPESELEQPKRATKVVTGEIVKRKKSIIDKFTNTFFGDDAKSVVSYVMWDVLVPAAKDTIFDMIRTGAEMLIFGESRRDGIRRDRSKSYVSYNAFYGRDRDRRDRSDRKEFPVRSNRHSFDDILIPSKTEAEEVLIQMADMIETYDQVTVADFYDMVGITTEFTDNRYGWHNINDAYVRRDRGGYVVVLPRVEVLE